MCWTLSDAILTATLRDWYVAPLYAPGGGDTGILLDIWYG